MSQISGPPHLRARSDPPKHTIHQAVDESDELRVTPSAPSVPRNDGISPHRGSLGGLERREETPKSKQVFPCFPCLNKVNPY